MGGSASKRTKSKDDKSPANGKSKKSERIDEDEHDDDDEMERRREERQQEKEIEEQNQKRLQEERHRKAEAEKKQHIAEEVNLREDIRNPREEEQSFDFMDELKRNQESRSRPQSSDDTTTHNVHDSIINNDENLDSFDDTHEQLELNSYDAYDDTCERDQASLMLDNHNSLGNDTSSPRDFSSNIHNDEYDYREQLTYDADNPTETRKSSFDYMHTSHIDEDDEALMDDILRETA